MGCTNKVEENKISYLEYKNELQKKEIFDTEEQTEFNTYFNIERENEEIINYSIIINNPCIDMHRVKALLIHDCIQDDIFPSVGILSEPVELKKDSDDKIVLKGKIQTTDNIQNARFKLYLEYVDSEGLENKIYYQVARG
jgi:hypothetical protein